MLHKTKGIVLHKTRYSDTSLIVKIYTEELGLQSYLIQGARSKKAKIKANLMQPLTMLDMVVTFREKTSLQRIKEARLFHPFSSIPYDVTKNTIALFLTELLFKTLREESPNPQLFTFLVQAITWLDLTEENCSNYHLLFLVKLSRYLGFYPQGEYSPETPYFDLSEGLFRIGIPAHHLFLSEKLSQYLWALLGTNFEGLKEIKMSQDERRELLRKLVDYYRVHLDTLKEIKSHKVLETVMG